MQKSFALTALVAVLAQQVAADKCYALALSSGDQNSMYQAGVIKGLTQNSDASTMNYSAISGVSGGAINAAILANFAAGQEGDAADRMKTFWENSANTKLYKDWLGGLAEGLLLKGGLWNDAAVLDFLKTEFVDIKPTNRWIDVGLTDVLKGTYVDFKEEDLSGDNLSNVMYAQFAQAGIFPPVEYNNTDYFDGSTIWDLDIFSVVNQCQAMGFKDEDIVVDTILTSEKTLKVVDASDYKSIQMLWRYLEVSRYYSNMDGLLRAQFAYPDVHFRHTVAPSKDMPSSFYPLNLDQSQVDEIWDLGVTDGTKAASETSTEDLTQFFSLKKKNDARVQGGVSYDTFLSMKQNGEFEDFKLHEDKQMQAMFLQ
jgi:predicted patatin/cPLA2 family phospholipase|mmetsp:Transcript_39330/g.51476  ORF Transcript_39330/g.51476 Transcript_39330/m.51476 type:complete len:369 (-) Transcript_39330:214-1320(-)|eukprot:CAMPEP_0185568750 /NCGR_PEP_ID=MMETSP0434-20130131/1611_1 /TAXON_ID=626734 ORGANISM="Favella taraikaensis, Strain Fe Narragansett Bay" /NCGR_SAMPLE_ID=MMETSP0434 /ASSEMBLY_ACC=CAM_ASM_000379 /LENGTH=368 /DNA_ID=CAMNT_0028183357 /DNA_START=31 /DNA_END=1137 /DNA_ORIENTATION=+